MLVEVGILLPVILRLLQPKGKISAIIFYGVIAAFLLEALEAALLLDTIYSHPKYYQEIKYVLGISVIVISIGNTAIATMPLYHEDSGYGGELADMRSEHPCLFKYMVAKFACNACLNTAFLSTRSVVLAKAIEVRDPINPSFLVWGFIDFIGILVIICGFVYTFCLQSSNANYEPIRFDFGDIHQRESVERSICVKIAYAMAFLFLCSAAIGIGIGAHIGLKK